MALKSYSRQAARLLNSPVSTQRRIFGPLLHVSVHSYAFLESGKDRAYRPIFPNLRNYTSVRCAFQLPNLPATRRTFQPLFTISTFKRWFSARNGPKQYSCALFYGSTILVTNHQLGESVLAFRQSQDLPSFSSGRLTRLVNVRSFLVSRRQWRKWLVLKYLLLVSSTSRV